VNGDYLALAARIRAALADVGRVAERAAVLRDKAQTTGDDGFWDGVALNLHGFYAGVEQIFEDISRVLDGGTPAGAAWHFELLLQMSAEVSGVRPAVITRETRACLDEFRAFRHIVRNVYAFQLRPDRLAALVAGLAPCLAHVRASLLEFAAHLERLAAA
jgi:hypothetical protein